MMVSKGNYIYIYIIYIYIPKWFELLWLTHIILLLSHIYMLKSVEGPVFWVLQINILQGEQSSDTLSSKKSAQELDCSSRIFEGASDDLRCGWWKMMENDEKWWKSRIAFPLVDQSDWWVETCFSWHRRGDFGTGKYGDASKPRKNSFCTLR